MCTPAVQFLAQCIATTSRYGRKGFYLVPLWRAAGLCHCHIDTWVSPCLWPRASGQFRQEEVVAGSPAALCRSGSPEAAKLQLHMFQQPVLLTLHHYSSVKLPPSTPPLPTRSQRSLRGVGYVSCQLSPQLYLASVRKEKNCDIVLQLIQLIWIP